MVVSKLRLQNNTTPCVIGHKGAVIIYLNVCNKEEDKKLLRRQFR